MAALVPAGLVADHGDDQQYKMLCQQEHPGASTINAPFIHEAHGSAFERSSMRQESQQPRSSNASGIGVTGRVANPHGPGVTGEVLSSSRTSACPSDMQPVMNGVRNVVGSKIPPSPSLAEQRDHGSGEPCGPQLTRVETFSEVRKRFEEAHAAGLLHESTAC